MSPETGIIKAPAPEEFEELLLGFTVGEELSAVLEEGSSCTGSSEDSGVTVGVSLGTPGSDLPMELVSGMDHSVLFSRVFDWEGSPSGTWFKRDRVR